MNTILQTISNLIDKSSVAFISYIDEQGFPNTKAMLAPRKRENLTAFYFTTNTSSQAVKYYMENSKACLYFCDSSSFQGITFIGHAKVLQDQANKNAIWQENDEIYYSKGVTDPDYCVIKFTAKKARYYSKFKTTDLNIT